MVKKIIGYYLLCFLLWICAVLYSSYELWIIVILMAVFPIIMASILYIIKNKIEVKAVICEDKVNINDNITIEIHINNRTFFPVLFLQIEIKSINSLYNVEKKEKLEITTIKYGKQTFTFLLNSKSCGHVTVSVANIKVIDYMKMFKINKKENLSKTVLVMPNIVIPECEKIPNNAIVATDSDTFSKTEKGNDPAEVFDYRKYVAGDELNTINWKMSAKCGEYMVKEHSKPLTNGVVIMLELLKDKEDKTDVINALITTICGLSIKMLDLGYEHSIVWYDNTSNTCENIKIKKKTTIDDILSRIYKASFYCDNTKVLEKYLESYEDASKTHIYYVGTSCSTKDIEKLAYKNENVIKRYILVSNNNLEDKEIEESEDNDILLQKVSIDDMDNNIMTLQF